MNLKKNLLLFLLCTLSYKSFSAAKTVLNQKILEDATFKLLTKQLEKALLDEGEKSSHFSVVPVFPAKKQRKKILGTDPKLPFTTRAEVEKYLKNIDPQNICNIKDTPWGESQKEFFKTLLLCCRTKEAQQFLLSEFGFKDLLLPHETSMIAFNLGLTEDSQKKNSKETNRLKIEITKFLNPQVIP